MNTAIELLTRILCDNEPPEPASGAYLYCTTVDNQDSVFSAAQHIIDHTCAGRILILEAPAMSGYPGATQCRHGLQESGLPTESITGVPVEATTSLNTLIESEALVRFARDQAFTSLIVVSPPFHHLRAFMTAVTVALEEYPQLSIYSHPGATQPWMEAVIHSQGTLQASRRQLIQEELGRISTYQDKGDLARFEDVLDYMNRRDMAF